jgi:hypothetical protein
VPHSRSARPHSYIIAVGDTLLIFAVLSNTPRLYPYGKDTGGIPKTSQMQPLISRLLPTVHCDSKPSTGAGIITSVRSAVSAPENELRRWRKTFDANAKVEVEGQKFVWCLIRDFALLT